MIARGGAYSMDEQDRQAAGHLDGGCGCGAIRYRVAGKALWAANCHCRSCQRATGAAFASWAGFAEENFTVIRGTLAAHASSPGVRRGFCGNCGGPLTFASDHWPDEVHILIPTLDDPGAIAPRAHIYLEHKLPWLELGDGLKQFQRFPGDES